MAKLFENFASERPDEIALVDERGESTWAEFNERVNRLVNALTAAGYGPDTTVALVAGNRREWIEVSAACSHTGMTFAPVNWHWASEEVAYVLDDSAATVVIAGDRFVDLVLDALPLTESDRIELLLVAGDVPDNERVASYEAFLGGGDPAEPTVELLGGPMFYTSGTTGRPKGVRSFLSGGGGIPSEVMALVAASFNDFVPANGRTLLVGPAYHSAQWAFSYFPFINGSGMVLQHGFDQARALASIDEYGITHVHLVPTQFKRFLDLPDDVQAAFDGSSLEVVWHGAAPCPPQIKRRMIEWWGPIISEYYGSTEGAVISAIRSEDWLRKGGSVGRPLPFMEVIVTDDDGNRLEQGEEGILWFRNERGTDFEYHNAPEKTAEAHLEPGVFSTGDIGYIDDEGYMWLSDRKIDMIISGGVNIYPAEIEGVIASHEAVDDVAVIGVPDDEFGESVKAVVAVEDGIDVGPELTAALQEHCREHLAGYKVPRSVDYVDQLPRTGSGKLQKHIIREPYWAGTGRRI
jgi:long-chain acyl-CoA synthetase